MLRKLLLAGAAVAALCVPAIGTSKAQAGQFGFDFRYKGNGFSVGSGYGNRSYHRPQRHHEHQFHVLYRDCWHSPWRCYGIYGCDSDAQRVADSLRWRGYNVRVSCD